MNTLLMILNLWIFRYLDDIDCTISSFEVSLVLLVLLIHLLIQLFPFVAMFSEIIGLCKIKRQESQNCKSREITNEDEDSIDDVTEFRVGIDFDDID